MNLAPRLAAAGALVLAALAPVSAQDDLERRLEQLERRFAEQDRQLDAQRRQLDAQHDRLRQQDRSVNVLRDRHTASAWPALAYGQPDPDRERRWRAGAFFLDSPDGKIRLRLNGRLHADARIVLDDDDSGFNNSFLVRRARLTARIELYDWVRVKLAGEFGEGEVELADGWVELAPSKHANLRVGQQRVWFGFHRTRSSRFMTHVERPVGPASLLDGRDIGVVLHGELLWDHLHYYLGLYNGSGDNLDRDTDDDVDFVGRLVVTPIDLVSLGVSFAYTPSDHDAEGPDDVETAGDKITEFLNYDGDNLRRGTRLRFGADLQLRWGPLEVVGELVVDQQREVLSDANQLEDLTAMAFSLDASWVLTGEDKVEDLSPRRPLYSFGELGPGAWEIALRYEHVRADSDAIDLGFAEGSDRLDSVTTTVNWYLLQGVRLGLSVVYSRFGDDIGPNLDQDDEIVILSRFGVHF